MFNQVLNMSLNFELIHSSQPPIPSPLLGQWGGGGGDIEEGRRGWTQVKLGFWVGLGILGGGDFFQVRLGNSLYEKLNANLKQKKKDFDCMDKNYNIFQTTGFNHTMIFFKLTDQYKFSNIYTSHHNCLGHMLIT